MRRFIVLIAVLALASAAYATDYTYVGSGRPHTVHEHGWHNPYPAGTYAAWDNELNWHLGAGGGYPGHFSKPQLGNNDKATRTGVTDDQVSLLVPSTLYVGEFYADNGNFCDSTSGHTYLYTLADNGQTGDFTFNDDATGHALERFHIEADGDVRLTGDAGNWTPGGWTITMNGVGSSAGARKDLDLSHVYNTTRGRPLGKVTINEGAYVDGTGSTNPLTLTFVLAGDYVGNMEARSFTWGSGVWTSGKAYALLYGEMKTAVIGYDGGTYADVWTMPENKYPGGTGWARTIRLKGDMTCEDFVGHQYTTGPNYGVGLHEVITTDNGSGKISDLHVKGNLVLGNGAGDTMGRCRPSMYSIGFIANSSQIIVDGDATFSDGAYIEGGTSQWEFKGDVRFSVPWYEDPEASGSIPHSGYPGDVNGIWLDNCDMAKTQIKIKGAGTQVLDFDQGLGLGYVEIAQTGSKIQMDDNMLLLGNLKFTSASTVTFTNETDAFIFGGGIDNETGQRLDAGGVNLHNVSIIGGSNSYVYLDSNVEISDNLNIASGCKLFLNGYTLLNLEGGDDVTGSLPWDKGEIVGEIPEPGTLLLLGSGLLGVLGVVRRRRMR